MQAYCENKKEKKEKRESENSSYLLPQGIKYEAWTASKISFG